MTIKRHVFTSEECRRGKTIYGAVAVSKPKIAIPKPKRDPPNHSPTGCSGKSSRTVRRDALRSGAFLEMLRTQQGLCAICSEPMKAPYIDHNHQTGEIRSLLCSRCNFVIGMASDDSSLLRRAATYVEKFNG